MKYNTYSITIIKQQQSVLENYILKFINERNTITENQFDIRETDFNNLFFLLHKNTDLLLENYTLYFLYTI